GFHLRTQNGVDARKLVEGEHGLLHAEVIRYDFSNNTLFFQGFSCHTSGRHLSQGQTDALGDEGHGAGGAGVDLDDVDSAVLPGELDVHQAADVQLPGHDLDDNPHLVDDLCRQNVGGQRAGVIAGR